MTNNKMKNCKGFEKLFIGAEKLLIGAESSKRETGEEY